MNDGDTRHCDKCSTDVLEAVYQLNVEAKKHGESAADAYESGWKEQARIHSQKKKALYSVKGVILHEFVDSGCVDEVREHEINGRTYYCLYVGEFSFHTPVTEWDTPDFTVTTSECLESFDSSAESRSDYMEEREALQRVTEEFESPNNHLEAPFTHSDYGSTFVGWSYLPGAVEEGDRVPDTHLRDRYGEGDFGLNVGDVFQTRKGQCEVVDRYHAYLSPLWDRSPVLQQAAYDVMLDGERKEAVRQRRIIDDWVMLADSLADPLPGVDGELGDPEYVRGHVESLTDAGVEFEIGDILELQPRTESADSVYCRLCEAHVSYNLLLGEYEPVPPTEDAPLGTAIHEIADDVVAVHEEPPIQNT